MWVRDIDTGKWIKQSDTLNKENFENLKIDLEKVKLYSKCLSGATYLTINDFDNLYPSLEIEKIGFYNGGTPNFRGPSIRIDEDNSVEFYEKYLKEDGFTMKTLFTPEKLLKDQTENLKYVDVATTESITLTPSSNITIDGVKLINGHRLLVKNQKSFITLSNVDEEDYFTNTLPVSSFTYSAFEVTSKTYEYYSTTNGIYYYDGYNLTKTEDLSNYENSYKLILSVKLGDQNGDKQFHLERLKNGYYPVEGESIEFKERTSWVLRHRVDYNNVFDLNFYDIKYFPAEQIYDKIKSYTYSIPERVISVGEFGVILNNQDLLDPSATYSISNIIRNKYKVNLRSIDKINNYYWICGDEGILLKVSKIDFTIEQIDLGEDLNFTSVSFYGDLYGVVVGKFNTIYYTRDGGYKWIRVQYDDFNIYSYNKVLHFDENVVYIVGESGLFVELVYSNDVWLGYKRNIVKQLSDIDFYPLVEDINDLSVANFTNLQISTFSQYIDSNTTLENSLVYRTQLSGDNLLSLSVTTPLLDTFAFKNSISQFYISCSFSHASGFSYSTSGFGEGFVGNYEIASGANRLFATFSLPTVDSNILYGAYNISLYLAHDYNYQNPSVKLDSLTYSYFDFSIKTKKGNLLLMTGNNEILLCYDKDKIIDLSGNQFVYMSFSQSLGDGVSIAKRPNDTYIYLSGSKLFKFRIGDFNNITDTTTNLATSNLEDVYDYFSNKIFSKQDKIYLAGNSSLLKVSDYSSFDDLDPTFNSRQKSKFLILDYDIGSKLNFFDDNGQYRLPQEVQIELSGLTVSGTTFSISSVGGETSWIDYYSDSEKTFEYNTHIEDSNVVKFSPVFSYDPYHTNFTASSVGTDISLFDTMLPHFSDSKNSEFIETDTLPNRFRTDFDVLLYKNLAIIKRSYITNVGSGGFLDDYINLSDKTKVGDILQFSSDIVETQLLVNKVRHYISQTSVDIGSFTQSKPPTILNLGRIDTYLYAYTDFNENILNNLRKNTNSNKTISIKNLNRYKDQDDLISNFNKHPYGFGYKISKSSNYLTFNGVFNEKSAYYNLQCGVSVNQTNYPFVYKDSFLNFGFTPTYNIFTMLNKINDQIFTTTKDFKILPKYYDLTGNNENDATDNNIYVPTTVTTNTLRFGKNYYQEWRTLMINTFVDLLVKTSLGNYPLTQFLIIEKYYDPTTDAYYMKFNKKIDFPEVGLLAITIESRNSLSQISEDLQQLNNIHRSENVNTILWKSGVSYVEKSFTNYESSIKTKFSTESYLKAFVSDYDIQQNISAILYNDRNFEVAMNVINLEKEIIFEVIQISPGGLDDKVTFSVLGTQDELKVGDLIYLEVDFLTSSTMVGYQTIIFVNANFIKTSRDYDFTQFSDTGRIKFIKKDPFFNFQPVDIFRSGSDRKVTRSVEILPKNTILTGSVFSLRNVDLTKYKIEFVDGLSLEEVAKFYHWILEAEISNALIGKDENGIVWYSGTWRCGRWFGGTWQSGRWLSGDWYDGVWNAFSVTNNIISAKVDKSFSDPILSIWYNGRWFKGTWYNGTWYNGRRYDGDWLEGLWFNGIWNDGTWFDGLFQGGVWVNGTWERGIFNCDNKPSYWIYGKFKSGDFENGMWYNGVFGNEQMILSRFGTRSNNSRTSTWHSGKWIDGEFHSFLNTDTNTSLPTVSNIHKFSVWRTGIWSRGDWYGGIAYNIDFRGGTWYGGILEEIQVIGIDSIMPYETSKNKIYLNGIFKFNPGDEIWIIDDDRNTPFSPLGNNEVPRKYRINQIIEDDVNKQTGLFLNYNLSSLGVTLSNATQTYSNVDLGLRVVSYFKDVQWRSGLWTNGIFDGKQFDSGIWYNGIFDGNWGN